MTAQRRDWVRWVLICLALAVLLTAYALRYPNTDPDQHIFGSMILKDLHPELYPLDFFLSDQKNFQFYIPWYRALAAWVVGDARGEDLLVRYNLLLFPSYFLFLLGMYLLIWQLTGKASVGWIVALSAVLTRQCLSVNPFGIGLAQSMVGLKLFFAGVPWILYILVRMRLGRSGQYLACFLLGLLSNLHPILGLGIMLCMGAAVWVIRQSIGWKWSDGFVSAAAFAAGFSPFVFQYLHARPPVMGAGPTLTADEFWTAFSPAWGYLPVSLKGLRNFLLDALPLLCFSALAIRGRSRGRPGQRPASETPAFERFFWVFAAAALIVPIVVSAAIQTQSHLTNRPPVIGLEPMRWTSFIYLPLFVFTSFFLADAIDRRRSRLTILAAVLLLFAQKEFPGRQIVREALRESGLHSEKRLEVWTRETRRKADLQELAEWVRRHTRADDLFFHPHYDFRFYAERSIVVGWKDGSMLTRAGPGRVREWLSRSGAVREALDSKDPRKILDTARQYGCHYIVLRSGPGRGLDRFQEAPLYENQTYRIYPVTDNAGKS